MECVIRGTPPAVRSPNRKQTTFKKIKDHLFYCKIGILVKALHKLIILLDRLRIWKVFNTMASFRGPAHSIHPLDYFF